jgi:hypothetical protein
VGFEVTTQVLIAQVVINTQTKPQPVSVIMKSTSYGSKVELKSSCFFLNVVLFMQTIYFFVMFIGENAKE